MSHTDVAGKDCRSAEAAHEEEREGARRHAAWRSGKGPDPGLHFGLTLGRPEQLGVRAVTALAWADADCGRLGQPWSGHLTVEAGAQVVSMGSD